MMCETYVISNVINAQPRSSANCQRHKKVMRDGEVVSEQELISISSPKCVDFMINHFSSIGGQNNSRQGSLPMGNDDTTASHIYYLD